MKRLVYKVEDVATLKEVGAMVNQPHLLGWRISVVSDRPADVAAANMRNMSLLRRSDVLSFGWRGGLWGGVSSVLAILLIGGLYGNGDGFAQQVLLVALPLCCVFFGAWEGGFLGLTKVNPGLRPFMAQVEAGAFIVIVDVRPEDERLVKKLMGLCGSEQLAEYCSRIWTLRGPTRPRRGAS
ncbi:hypothetical protein HCU74_05940 [Spongiibacter sp. KMU-166]|uniref:DUF1269 domain-containing protein n=1 Tax=Spongiibacter thalassae TaxID=2721624 RepID=A0ABX1GFH7_9GAMM|nr:hypothetical protein [Spongiibacter thalassae]NKI16959.1 hypothetical protein [Spongiibacter thalassae]